METSIHCISIFPFVLGIVDNKLQKVFISKGSLSDSSLITASESICEIIQTNAGYNEVVECYLSGSWCSKFATDCFYSGGRKTISHLSQGLAQFVAVNSLRVVSIVHLKRGSPLVYETVHLLKFIEINGSTIISVKHCNKSCTSLYTESATSSI